MAGLAMGKAYSNDEALEALRGLGWRYVDTLKGVRDAFVLFRDGHLYDQKSFKIHKSGVNTGTKGRHRYGISIDALSEVDFVVLWARDESEILIFPVDELKSLLESKKHQASIHLRQQWVVNVYFEENGRHRLVPCGFHDHILVKRKYAHPVVEE